MSISIDVFCIISNKQNKKTKTTNKQTNKQTKTKNFTSYNNVHCN